MFRTTNRKQFAIIGISVLFGLIAIATVYYWQSSQKARLEGLALRNEQLAMKVEEGLQRIGNHESQLQTTSARLKIAEYSALLRQARRQFEQGRLEEAFEFLNATDHSLRGWEYRYLLQKFDPSLSSWSGNALAFLSPSGTKVAFLEEIYDVTTGEQVVGLENAKKPPSMVTFSLDGKYIAGTGWHIGQTGGSLKDSRLSIWDANTGKLVHQFEPMKSKILNISLSADGSRVAAAFNSATQAFDTLTGEKLADLDKSGKYGLVFSPSNPNMVVAVDFEGLTCRDLISQKNLWSTEKVPDAISFMPSGNHILIIEDHSKLRCLNARNGEELWMRDAEEQVASLTVSPSANLIGMGLENGEIIVLDPVSRGNSRRVGLHGGRVHHVAFQNENRLVSVGADSSEKPNGSCEVKVWQLNDESDSQLTTTGSVTSLALDNDGKRLAAGIARVMIATADNGGSLDVWDLANWDLANWDLANKAKQRKFGDSGVLDIKFLDKSTIVLSDQSSRIRLFNIEDSNEICAATLDGWPSDICVEGSDTIVTLMSDCITRWKFSSEDNELVRVYDSKPFDRKNKYGALAFAGRRLFAAGENLACFEADEFVQVYEKDWDCLITALAISGDGKTIAIGDSAGFVSTLDAENGELLTREQGSFRNRSRGRKKVTSIAFIPNEQRIIVGWQDNRVSLWDAKTGKECISLRGHDNGVTAIAFNEKTDSLITGQGSFADLGNIKFWNTRPLASQKKK